MNVFIDPPPYLTIVTQLMLISGVAAFIALVIGFTRYARRIAFAVGFHLVLLAICLSYFVAVAMYRSSFRRSISNYERLTGNPAPAIEAAVNREVALRAVFGAAVTIVVSSSYFVWRSRR